MGRRTELSEELLKHDVDVSWWVTPDAYERGYYTKLHAALRHWLAEEFPFDAAYYSNAAMPEDVRVSPTGPAGRSARSRS